MSHGIATSFNRVLLSFVSYLLQSDVCNCWLRHFKITNALMVRRSEIGIIRSMNRHIALGFREGFSTVGNKQNVDGQCPATAQNF
jgi:hypothetical protein